MQRSLGLPELGAYYPSSLIGSRQGPSRTEAGIDALFVGELIGALGRSDFPVRFARACQVLFRAELATAFSVDKGRAACLLASRRDGTDLTPDRSRFFELYYDARDPFLPKAQASGAAYVDCLVRSNEVHDAVYRQRMFADVCADAKISILSRRYARQWYFNFYVRSRVGSGLTDVMALLNGHRAILTETLAAHGRTIGDATMLASGSQSIETAIRQRFPILSRREVEVCAWTATGSSVEDIAAGLNISPTTVATFRRRAYAKLGIGSQKELFAYLANQMMPSLSEAQPLIAGR